jgi:hypothetical protein
MCLIIHLYKAWFCARGLIASSWLGTHNNNMLLCWHHTHGWVQSYICLPYDSAQEVSLTAPRSLQQPHAPLLTPHSWCVQSNICQPHDSVLGVSLPTHGYSQVTTVSCSYTDTTLIGVFNHTSVYHMILCWESHCQLLVRYSQQPHAPTLTPFS